MEENKKVEENQEVEEVKVVESDKADETQIKKGSKKKIIIGVTVAVIVLAVAIGVYANNKLSKIQHKEVNEDKLQISKEVEKEITDEYLNVAIFGTNVRSAEDKTVDSDAVYVASLNLKTKEVKILPVYGNTLMQHGGNTLKMKDAYVEGGAEEAIAVLNENLELNIKDYVTLNFQVLVDMIDTIGGIEIDVTEEEIPHINGYDQDIAKSLGKEVKQVTKAGKQLLDGCQATGYCRIRVTEGGDVKRGSRQTEVINKVLNKVKDSGFTYMDKIMDIVFPNVQTNFDKTELISYGKDAASYTITQLQAYPRTIKEQVRKPEKEGVQFADYEEVVEGTNCEQDVKDIHKELFEEKEK